MIVLIFRKSHVWNTTFFSWTFFYAVIFNYFVSAIENCPNIAMILLFLRTSSGHTFQGIPYFYVGTCAPHDDSQISYMPHALLLFSSNIVFFFSSGLARLAPIIHKKIHGVFFRTICCFLWCWLSFSALPFLGNERMPRSNLLSSFTLSVFITMKAF